MFNLRAFLVPLALAFLLVLAACGGDDDDESAGEPTDEATAAAQTDAGDDDDEDAEPTDAPDDTKDDDGAASDTHVCDLVTPEEVSAAVGVEVGEGRDYQATAADATQCEWVSTDDSVTVYAEVLPEGGQSYFDAVHFEDDPAFEEQSVEGIGDEAVYSDLGVLDVVDGDTFVSVQMVVFSDLDELPAATALALVILEKL